MGPGPEPEPISFSACSCLSLLPPSFCLSPHPSHLVFLSLGSSPAGVSDPLRLTISLKPSSTFQPNIKALSLLPSPTPPPRLPSCSRGSLCSIPDKPPTTKCISTSSPLLTTHPAPPPGTSPLLPVQVLPPPWSTSGFLALPAGPGLQHLPPSSRTGCRD